MREHLICHLWLLVLAVTTPEWARAVLEWSQHSLLGYWVYQWIHAGGAGEQVPGDGHQGPVELV